MASDFAYVLDVPLINCRLRDEMASQVDVADMMWGDLVAAVGTSELCGDVVIKILAMLPIKSILRCKSVCKAWYALLNSTAFIRHHCDIVTSSAEMISMLSLLVHVDIFSISRYIHLIFSLLLEGGNPIVKNFKLPFEGEVGYIRVVGSINGLVCLTLCKNFTSFVLWNPAIRKHSRIRNPLVVIGQDDNVSVGFAFDQRTYNYKIVRIVHFKDSYKKSSPVAKVEIYSTGTDTWRTTEILDFPWLYEDMYRCGDVVSGVPYWLSPEDETRAEKLIWFDASTEAFKYYTLPPDEHSHVYVMRLGVMGKHPVLMDCKYDWPLDSDSDSEEVCIKSACIRKLTKSDDGGNDSFHMEKLTIKLGPNLAGIVGFGRNGEIIAEGQDYSTLHLCDQDEIKHLASYDEGFASVYYYNESLVWPCTLA